ncbi:molecular chaperone Tir [Tolypothrix campylonemoides VB511288]|nr:molecular chaperone Tir [Tolypothrix campylonemoides VB511288]
MPRSVKVGKEFIDQVKAAVQRQGYPRQKDLAEELGLSLATVSNFLNGKSIDCLNFQEICDRLGLDWKAIADHNSNGSNDTTAIENKLPPEVSFATCPDESEMEDFIYVERPPIESICEQALCQSGALLRIKAPGLMGKTSLMDKVLPQLVSRKGYKIVRLNLHYAEEKTHFSNLDKFLQWFCVSVGERLGMPNQLADYWDEEYSTSKTNCNTYFEQYLLKHSETPIVLCLDEVERVFPHPVATEFLGLLRVWHEDAKTRHIWKKLRLVVIHSTEVYVKLNVNESPFNVGVAVELREFTPEQVQNLAEKYGLTWDLAQVTQLMDMVGGHPYLLGQAFSYLQMYGVTLEELLQNAPTEAGIYGNHLRRYWGMLQQHLGLVEALKKVVMTSGTVQLEPIQGYTLYRLGLVHQAGNKVKIACNLYRQYFDYCFQVSSLGA